MTKVCLHLMVSAVFNFIYLFSPSVSKKCFVIICINLFLVADCSLFDKLCAENLLNV